MTWVSAFSDPLNDSAIYAVFHSIFRLLKWVGCYTSGGLLLVSKDELPNPTETAEVTPPKRTWKHLHKLYCILVNLFLIVVAADYVHEWTQERLFSTEWFRKCFFCVFQLFFSTILLSFSFKLRNHRLQKWICNFCQHESKWELTGHIKKCTRKINLVNKWSLLLFVLYTALISVMTSTLSDNHHVFLVPYLPKLLNYVLLGSALLYEAISFCSFLSLLSSTSLFIFYEFERQTVTIEVICNSLKENAKGRSLNDTTAMCEFEQLSELYDQHQETCELLDEINRCFDQFLLLIFFITIPLNCSMLYFLLTKMEIFMDAVITGFTMTLTLIPLIIFCVVGSQLNVKAHEPLQHLWKIPLQSLSEKTARMVLMFTTKLTGSPIGYSVLDLFKITFSTSLTILGTFVTYFIVVVQFKPSASVCGCFNQSEIT